MGALRTSTESFVISGSGDNTGNTCFTLRKNSALPPIAAVIHAPAERWSKLERDLSAH
jgi:hypothetical protein